MKPYGEAAYLHFASPDAGIWEFRTMEGVFTYSALMCWAACDRLIEFARHLHDVGGEERFRHLAEEIRRKIDEEAWNPTLKAYSNAFGSTDADATLLLMPALVFIAADDPRFISTVSFIERELRVGDHMMRHVHPDDFGIPVNSFVSCTLWLIDALSRSDRLSEAKRLFENLMKYSVHDGYFSASPKFLSNGELDVYGGLGVVVCAQR